MPILNKTIPEYIVDIVFSEEYIDFCHVLERDFSLSEEQMTLIDDILTSLFEKTLSPAELVAELKRKLGLDDEKTKEISRRLFLNIALVFSAYFGDFLEQYGKEFGRDPDKDLAASPLFLKLMADMNAALKKKADEIASFDWEQQSKDMIELFEKNLLEQFYTPDGLYKVSLNNTIFALFNTVDDYNLKLLDAMYKNEQEIGDQPLLATDGSRQNPTVGNWIKDYLGFSEGVVSGIEIAKYVSQSKNVMSMSKSDKDALQRLLETFSVLKNFPESFEKMTLDTWKVIPYYIPEESMKLTKSASSTLSQAKTLEPGSGTRLRQGFGAAVAKTEPDPKLTKTPPTPTITIVEAPVVSVPVVVPVPVPMAKPVLPLKEKVTTPPVIPSEAQQSRGISVNPETTGTLPSVRDDVRIDFAVCAEAALAGAGVALGEDNRERVKNIIVTRLRNIRNAIDTKDRLCAPTSEGGAGLLPEDAEKLLREAQNASKIIAEGKLQDYLPPPVEAEMKMESGTRLRQGFGAAVAKTEPDPTQAPKLVIKEVGGVPTIVEKGEKKTNGKKKEEKTTELATELTQERGRTGSDPTPPPSPPVVVPAHLEDAKDIPVVVTTQTPGSLANTRDDKGSVRDDGKNVGASKKPIPDVKAPPRLVGPIDELRALTIKDIRRISEDPAVATQKIAEKINALGKESLSKKAEAINAWKGSPVYQLYLEIGQLNFGQDMSKLSEDRKAGGKEYLTAKEFDALLDLNERLRF